MSVSHSWICSNNTVVFPSAKALQDKAKDCGFVFLPHDDLSRAELLLCYSASENTATLCLFVPESCLLLE